MASYALLASYSTVQVVSPTFVNDVVYCTVQTSPSNVIASRPVQASVFSSDGGGTELTNFANAIETLMSLPNVVAGIGGQQIDENGLLADYVIFTVEYSASPTSGTSATAQAPVPVGLLDFSDAEIGRVAEQDAEAIINGVAANLQSLASG